MLSLKDKKVLVKNVNYDGAEYDVVITYDDAAKEAKISQIVDAAGKNLLPDDVDLGWGQYRIATVGYLTLRGALAKAIAATKKVKADAAKELAAVKKAADAAIAAAKAEAAKLAIKVDVVPEAKDYPKTKKTNFIDVAKIAKKNW